MSVLYNFSCNKNLRCFNKLNNADWFMDRIKDYQILYKSVTTKNVLLCSQNRSSVQRLYTVLEFNVSICLFILDLHNGDVKGHVSHRSTTQRDKFYSYFGLKSYRQSKIYLQASPSIRWRKYAYILGSSIFEVAVTRSSMTSIDNFRYHRIRPFTLKGFTTFINKESHETCQKNLMCIK